jgi:hypothetical protein
VLDEAVLNLDRATHSADDAANLVEAAVTGAVIRLCLPCFANENLDRYKRAKEAGHPEDWPQVSWAIAEVIFDKYGEPFDAEALIRQGIINYHKSCE